MAFGRSNSLTLNTGAANSLFSNNNTQQQPQQSQTSLFGASTTASQPQQAAGLFGSSTTAAQPQQASTMFGARKAPPSLFGGADSTAQQQQSGSLFGGSTINNNINNNNNTTTTTTSSSLFGGLTQNQNQTQTQNQSQAGLFGAAKPTASLFGGSTAQPPQLLGPLGNSTARPLAGSLTMGQGSNNNNNQQTNTQPGVKIDLSNLRPTTRFSDLHDDLKKTIESIDSFIRQQESYASQCEGLVAGHKADVESIKPDVDLIQSNLETMELALENDGAAINNAKDLVQRDAADLIRVARMAENLGLPQQYHHHYYSHNTTNANNTTTHRPSSSSAASTATDDDHYDMNLVAYFATQAQVMQTTLDTYTSHMAEIEAHLRVVESSTVHQAHQLAAQRAGGGNGGGNNNHTQDQVRELAETLRGFEGGILAAAGKVGSCREGVNELILGNVRGAGSAADTRDSPFNYASRSVRF